MFPNISLTQYRAEIERIDDMQITVTGNLDQMEEDIPLLYQSPDRTITIWADSHNTADGDTLFVDAALDVSAGSFRLSDKIRGYNSDNTATAMPPKFEITGYNSTKGNGTKF